MSDKKPDTKTKKETQDEVDSFPPDGIYELRNGRFAIIYVHGNVIELFFQE